MGKSILILFLFLSSTSYMLISAVDSFNVSTELEVSITRIQNLLEGTKEVVDEKILQEFYSIPYHEDSAKYGARYGHNLKNIPDGLQLTSYDRKNDRYKEMLPYESKRVVLKKSVKGSDYINASPVAVSLIL